MRKHTNNKFALRKTAFDFYFSPRVICNTTWTSALFHALAHSRLCNTLFVLLQLINIWKYQVRQQAIWDMGILYSTVQFGRALSGMGRGRYDFGAAINMAVKSPLLSPSLLPPLCTSSLRMSPAVRHF